jgi:RND superfamily putative drug exporter
MVVVVAVGGFAVWRVRGVFGSHQYIIGTELHWLVLAMSVIVRLAVGSDYNLLLVSRFKEEIPGGLTTGIIRSMGGTGSVVTAAGLVFALTMASMVVSDLRIIGWAPRSDSACCSTHSSCGRS